MIGICGDFVAAGERCGALAKVWNELQGREGTVEGTVEEKAIAREGKGKVVQKEWTDGDYLKACANLAYESIELEVNDPAGGRSFLTQWVSSPLIRLLGVLSRISPLVTTIRISTSLRLPVEVIRDSFTWRKNWLSCQLHFQAESGFESTRLGSML